MDKVRELLSKGALDESHQLLTELIDARTADGGTEGGAELSDAFNTRGHIRYLWVDFDEAIRDYTEAIRLDPGSAVAHYNRGQVHYRLGAWDLNTWDLGLDVGLQPCVHVLCA